MADSIDKILVPVVDGIIAFVGGSQLERQHLAGTKPVPNAHRLHHANLDTREPRLQAEKRFVRSPAPQVAQWLRSQEPFARDEVTSAHRAGAPSCGVGRSCR